MKGTFNLGRYFGIKVQIHWTFLFLIGWVIFVELRKGSNLQTILLTLSFVLLIFVCVVLHEFGHALTARRYGIGTKQITLLPIGGVASLERMPEDPKQELVVAIAGPAVNLAIALLLLLFVNVQAYFTPEGMESLTAISGENYLFYLFFVNITLVIFNAIPAFPMDGGRVLRALLSFKMDRVKATKIAASLGQLIAVFFFFMGFFFNPFLILIAIFVFFGAQSENMMVHHLSLLRGHNVGEAMMTNITMVRPHSKILDLIKVLISGNEKNFVVEEEGEIKGIVHQQDIINAVHNRDSELEAVDIMDTDFETVDVNEKLVNFYPKILSKRNLYMPVTFNGKLSGAIDLENIREFVMIQSALHY